MRYLFLFLLSSCVAQSPVLCKTNCGVRLHGSPNGSPAPAAWTDCERVQRVETMTLSGLIGTGDSRLNDPAACSWLDGYSVWLADEPCWMDRWGRHVCGVTFCEFKTIQVGTLPDGGVPEESSLPHEFVHALQQCDATAGGLFSGPVQHENWADAGIFQAIGDIDNKLRNP